jgi:HK97 family phage major capsid protein
MTYLIVLVGVIDLILIWGTINQRILEKKSREFLDRNNVEEKRIDKWKKSKYSGVSIDSNKILDMYFSVPIAFINKSKWFLSGTDVMRHLYKLKDGTGQYLLKYENPKKGWRLLGLPVIINKNMCHDGISINGDGCNYHY